MGHLEKGWWAFYCVCLRFLTQGYVMEVSSSDLAVSMRFSDIDDLCHLRVGIECLLTSAYISLSGDLITYV